LVKGISITLIALFSLIQVSNLVVRYFNNCKAISAMAMETEESEKTSEEDAEETYAFFEQDLPSINLSYKKNQYMLLDFDVSQTHMAKPETPPPDAI
jgi:hypothetical protein